MCVRVMWCGKRMIIYTTGSWLFYALVDSQFFMKIYPFARLNFPPDRRPPLVRNASGSSPVK